MEDVDSGSNENMSIVSDTSALSANSWVFSHGREPKCFLPDTMFVKPHGLGSVNADSEIRIVDRGFVVDRPWINHAEKVINHVLWLIGLLREWLS